MSTPTTIAPLRPAATVVVLRPAATHPFDVLMVRRNQGSWRFSRHEPTTS